MYSHQFQSCYDFPVEQQRTPKKFVGNADEFKWIENENKYDICIRPIMATEEADVIDNLTQK